jgi:hypothetical protein
MVWVGERNDEVCKEDERLWVHSRRHRIYKTIEHVFQVHGG